MDNFAQMNTSSGWMTVDLREIIGMKYNVQKTVQGLTLYHSGGEMYVQVTEVNALSLRARWEAYIQQSQE